MKVVEIKWCTCASVLTLTGTVDTQNYVTTWTELLWRKQCTQEGAQRWRTSSAEIDGWGVRKRSVPGGEVRMDKGPQVGKMWLHLGARRQPHSEQRQGGWNKSGVPPRTYQAFVRGQEFEQRSWGCRAMWILSSVLLVQWRVRQHKAIGTGELSLKDLQAKKYEPILGRMEAQLMKELRKDTRLGL